MTTLADLAVALDRVTAGLPTNEPHHRSAWRTQSVGTHVDHASLHLRAYESGDRSEEHVSHAATQLLFALVLAAEERRQ